MNKTKFIAGMMFQNIYSRLNVYDKLNDMFTIDVSIPKRFFDSSQWNVFHDSRLPYGVNAGLEKSTVTKITNLVIKELEKEYEDYKITYEHVWYGKLFQCPNFQFKFSKKASVKELTINELEETLGYKIKIVGNKS